MGCLMSPPTLPLQLQIAAKPRYSVTLDDMCIMQSRSAGDSSMATDYKLKSLQNFSEATKLTR